MRSKPWRVSDCAQSSIAAIMVEGRSVIVPANVADVAGLIATALSIVKAAPGASA